MKEYIMALDQGTTSSRCIIFDKQGNIITKAQKEFTQIYPKPGWVEHNPMEIWSSMYAVCAEALAMVPDMVEKIDSIGITNQRETTILWNKNTGEPVYNAIVWQCRRTSDMIDEVKNAGHSDIIREKTGLVPDAYFSASKIAWILENVPGVREEAKKGNILFGTVDTFVMWKLTKGKVHATDYTNASRTMLFNIHTKSWDKELLELFKIPENILPEVFASGHMYGMTEEGIFGREIPIAGVAGDQQAALFGQCCFEPGEVKNTYGTGCFLLMNTGDKPIASKKGLLTTMAASTEGEVCYALEGSVFVAGAAVQWLRDGLRMVKDAGSTEMYATRVGDTQGMYVVPAFTGMGAPYWNQEVRGTVVGITRGCEKEHFVRATLEAVAYQTYDVLKAMEKDADMKLKDLKVDGGASANNFLVQFQADILETNVNRPKCIETTALGVAYLAGLTTGFYEDLGEVKKNWQSDKVFEPDMLNEVRMEKLRGWKRAVKCALAYTEEG